MQPITFIETPIFPLAIFCALFDGDSNFFQLGQCLMLFFMVIVVLYASPWSGINYIVVCIYGFLIVQLNEFLPLRQVKLTAVSWVHLYNNTLT